MRNKYIFSIICIGLIVLPAYMLRGTTPTNACTNIASIINVNFGAAGVSATEDDTYLYIESAGMADIPMMVGITSWQQQVPLPQDYTGTNKWVLTKKPVPAKEMLSLKNNFFRGAVGVAIDGVPIFNALNNRGEDALLAGELDEYGGHAGRADDYHYHIAPTYINKKLGDACPIAIMLDGYPLYGYNEPNGEQVNYKSLDNARGHEHGNMGYHYHASTKYPYINQAMRGEVATEQTQDGKAISPQPRTTPVRSHLEPLRGAVIIGFTQNTQYNSYELEYSYRGKNYTLKYAKNGEAWNFTIPNHSGGVLTETYTKGSQKAGASQRDKGKAPKR